MSNAPTNTMGAPITDQRIAPDMNEPPSTLMPCRNHTPPTSTYKTPMTMRTMTTSGVDSTVWSATVGWRARR